MTRHFAKKKPKQTPYTLSETLLSSMTTERLNKRLEIMELRRQSWTFQQIASKFGVTRQHANYLYHKYKNFTPQEWERLREVCDNQDSNTRVN